MPYLIQRPILLYKIDNLVKEIWQQRACVCLWTRRTAVIWGLSSSWGTPKPSDPFACVCIFMQGFEVVLLNASFGCIGKLFFNLAWQAYGLGFASTYHWVSIDVWAWGLWNRGFYLRRLFERSAPAFGCQTWYCPPPLPPPFNSDQGIWTFEIHTYFLLIVMSPHFYMDLRKTNTHIFTY